MKTFAVAFIVATVLLAQAHCWNSNNDDSESNESSQNNGGANNKHHHERHESSDLNHQHHVQNGVHDASYHDKYVGWDWTIADQPDAIGYVNKINRRLDQLPDNENKRDIKQRVINYANTNLVNCKSATEPNKLHKHCVGRLTGATMSLIGRLQNAEHNINFNSEVN